MMSCVSQMQAEEEKMVGEMLGDAVSQFRAVGAHGQILAEVSPFKGCHGWKQLAWQGRRRARRRRADTRRWRRQRFGGGGFGAASISRAEVMMTMKMHFCVVCCLLPWGGGVVFVCGCRMRVAS